MCVCVCGTRQARCAAFVCMLETVWLIQTGNCVGIHFKNSSWRHVNVCKQCIMTAIVVVGYDLLVHFSSSFHQCTHLRLRWVHGYMDDFILEMLTKRGYTLCKFTTVSEHHMQYSFVLTRTILQSCPVLIL